MPWQKSSISKKNVESVVGHSLNVMDAGKFFRRAISSWLQMMPSFSCYAHHVTTNFQVASCTHAIVGEPSFFSMRQTTMLLCVRSV